MEKKLSILWGKIEKYGIFITSKVPKYYLILQLSTLNDETVVSTGSVLQPNLWPSMGHNIWGLKGHQNHEGESCNPEAKLFQNLGCKQLFNFRFNLVSNFNFLIERWTSDFKDEKPANYISVYMSVALIWTV